MENIQKLNPKIREIEVGIKSFRTIKIYPLSAKDQMKLAGFFSEAVAKFMVMASGANNLQVVEFVRETVVANIEEILKIVTDYDEDLLGEIDNEQMVDIVDIIYEVNFADILEKKGKSRVVKMIKNKLTSMKSLPISSEPTPNTELTAILTSDTEKAD